MVTAYALAEGVVAPVTVLSLALFVVIELEVDEPLLDLRVFRYWEFTNSLLLIVVQGTAGAFGVAVFTAILTSLERQLMAGRTPGRLRTPRQHPGQ